MVYWRVLLTVTLAAVLVTAAAARGDDVADLKATFEQGVAALNKQDLTAFMALQHTDYTGFGATAPLLTEGKDALQAALQNAFSSRESTTIRPINPQFRVIGSTGIVQTYFTTTVKPKDGPATTAFTRGTLTYVKADEGWRVVAVHLSRIPSGN
jgi:ketosteroid isomerase-like protein